MFYIKDLKHLCYACMLRMYAMHVCYACMLRMYATHICYACMHPYKDLNPGGTAPL